MIYRPTDRTESRGGQRATRELAAVMVAFALFSALILQFACGGADPIRYRWVCPNNGRLARIGEPTATITNTLLASPVPGVGIWTPSPITGGQPAPLPSKDFGASMPFPPAAFTPDVFTLPDSSQPSELPMPTPFVIGVPTPDRALSTPSADDRTSQILGTATALSATATAIAERKSLATPGDGSPRETPTPEEGGYP